MDCQVLLNISSYKFLLINRHCFWSFWAPCKGFTQVCMFLIVCLFLFYTVQTNKHNYTQASEFKLTLNTNEYEYIIYIILICLRIQIHEDMYVYIINT